MMWGQNALTAPVIGNFGPDRTVFVSESWPPGVDPTRYFTTVQAAVDRIESALNPSISNPAAAILVPGVYTAGVIIRKDGVGLVGWGGQGTVRIRPVTGPALVISNATRATLDPWLAGGVANYDANYGTLVADGSFPVAIDNQFRNIDFAPQTNVDYPAVIAGVGAGTSFAGNEFNFMRCAFRNGNNSLSLWGRLANYVSIQDGSWAPGELRIQNVAGLWLNDSEAGRFHGSYDVGADQPSDPGNYGLSGGKSVLRGNLLVDGSARAGFDKLWNIALEGNVDVDGTGSVRLKGGIVEGNVNCEAAASFLAEGVHVQGSLTFAAGTGTAQMDGGRYIGALTDPGGKFVRNVGS